MKPRFLGLFLIMREQRIELVDHRLHFARQRRGDAAALPPAHRRDRTPDMAQRPQAVEGLERRENDEAERSEEHTSELQSLMRISYAVFCLKKKKKQHNHISQHNIE